MQVKPRHVACVVGNWTDFDLVDQVIQEVGGEFYFRSDESRIAPDERILGAFEASADQSNPSMKVGDWDAIKAHTSVVYFLSPQITPESAEKISATMIKIISALLRIGGVGAKSESAGISHGRDKWIEFANRLSDPKEDPHSRRCILVFAWVKHPILSESSGLLYSCGMHLLGCRDCEISDSFPVNDAMEWIEMMCLYAFADEAHSKIRNGSGFRLSDKSERLSIELVNCSRYDDDDFFFNRYGYFRLSRS